MDTAVWVKRLPFFGIKGDPIKDTVATNPVFLQSTLEYFTSDVKIYFRVYEIYGVRHPIQLFLESTNNVKWI